MKRNGIIPVLALSAAMLTACGNANAAVTAENLPEGTIYAEFTQGMPDGWHCADGWTNGSMFNVTWRKDNVTFNDGKMHRPPPA